MRLFDFSTLPSQTIILIVVLMLFDTVLKLIALWRSARNNHLAWFIFLAIINSVGILPILYLILYRAKSQKAVEP